MILLVDKITDNPIIGGLTYDIKKVTHNLQIIGVDFYNDIIRDLEKTKERGIVRIIAIGRYISLIQMEKDRAKGQMVFMNVNEDRAFALKIAEDVMKIADSQKNGLKYKAEFMEVFDKSAPSFRKHFNDVTLTTEAGPIMN